MPRPERPLEGDDPEVLRFAADLRLLRAKAGDLTYRQMARRAHYAAATLSEAASGRRLPTLAVTLAYVRACGGEPQEWERRWRELRGRENDELDVVGGAGDQRGYAERAHLLRGQALDVQVHR
ncbi:helix-turn-helix transcriptional regulator, partial [Nonomuraea sp. NPDC055795]